MRIFSKTKRSEKKQAITGCSPKTKEIRGKRSVLFSAFDPIRNIRAEVKMQDSRQLIDSL